MRWQVCRSDILRIGAVGQPEGLLVRRRTRGACSAGRTGHEAGKCYACVWMIHKQNIYAVGGSRLQYAGDGRGGHRSACMPGGWEA